MLNALPFEMRLAHKNGLTLTQYQMKQDLEDRLAALRLSLPEAVSLLDPDKDIPDIEPTARAEAIGLIARFVAETEGEPRPATKPIEEMTWRDIAATQPKASAFANPFTTVDARRSDPPTEWEQGFAAGIDLLSLDAASTDGDPLAERVSAHFGITPYTQTSPRQRLRIERERVRTLSGPYFRIRLVETSNGDRVRVTGPKGTTIPPAAYKRACNLLTTRLTALWGRMPTAREVRDAAPRIEAYRQRQRNAGFSYDHPPIPFEHPDEDLDGPREEIALTEAGEEFVDGYCHDSFGHGFDESLTEEQNEAIDVARALDLAIADATIAEPDQPLTYIRTIDARFDPTTGKSGNPLHFGSYLAADDDILA